MSVCKYCSASIDWIKNGERNIPVNPDGTPHRCQQGKKEVPPSQQSLGGKAYFVGTLKGFMQPNLLVTDDKRGDITLYAKDKWALVENIPVGTRIEYSYNNVGNLATIVPLSDQSAPAFKTGNEIKREQDQGAKPPQVTTPPPAVQQTSVSTSPSPAQTRMWSGETTLTIGVTINLENYENLRVEVTGAAADRTQMIEFLNETLGRFAQGSDVTRDKIDAYRKRVIMGAMSE